MHSPNHSSFQNIPTRRSALVTEMVVVLAMPEVARRVREGVRQAAAQTPEAPRPDGPDAPKAPSLSCRP